MVQYKYAINESGQIVMADDISGKPILESFICLGCNNELIAKVNGEHKKPHFAHKARVECCGETYLHRLGKSVFVETYKRCLETSNPFNIRLQFSRYCRKFSPLIMTDCKLGIVEKEFDLTTYYQDVFVEKRNGSFIPDVLLQSRSKPGDKIFIEIAVTHFISEKKECSGNRIIEIPLESEDDVSRINNALLTPQEAIFIGFNQKSKSVVDADCKCSHLPHYGFYVYQNGKSRLVLDSLVAVKSYVTSKKRSLLYSNILRAPNSRPSDIIDHGEYRGKLFREQINLAVQRGISIRNCFLCKYHGQNWDGENSFPIFCKAKKIRCNSNEAADCDWYRLNDQ